MVTVYSNWDGDGPMNDASSAEARFFHQLFFQGGQKIKYHQQLISLELLWPGCEVALKTLVEK